MTTNTGYMQWGPLVLRDDVHRVPILNEEGCLISHPVADSNVSCSEFTFLLHANLVNQLSQQLAVGVFSQN